jgi:hypothetical protein
MDTIIPTQPDSQATQPWNKDKLTGAKPPLRPKHVRAVRTPPSPTNSSFSSRLAAFGRPRVLPPRGLERGALPPETSRAARKA